MVFFSTPTVCFADTSPASGGGKVLPPALALSSPVYGGSTGEAGDGGFAKTAVEGRFIKHV